MKRYPLIAAFLAIALALSACGPKLPPNTSLEGKLAVRGNQLVQALRATIPAVKGLVCVSTTPQPSGPVPTCIPPATAVKIFEGLETAGKTSEQVADALRALDGAKTAQEQQAFQSKAMELLNTIQQTLLRVTVTPETEGARNAVVQILQTAMSILIAIGSFGAVG